MPQGSDSAYIHLLAGGLGGTLGAVLTCPLEVVKTRLQSSSCSVSFSIVSKDGISPRSDPFASSSRLKTTALRSKHQYGLVHCLKHIIITEGPSALMKGLGPNLVGVAPSRAIYFFTYAESKRFFNSVLPPETSFVHLCSAACAGLSSCTVTNPIWFVKTRLQLDRDMHGKSLTVNQCIRNTLQSHGIRGFYSGITASYYGITETMVHFVIYEAIKAKIYGLSPRSIAPDEERTVKDMLRFMVAGATSKAIATCIAYPHEVARTRLREEGSKYRSFWQTLFLVFREDGLPGVYRGLVTQLVRQIPNTAVMMTTYEVVIILYDRYSS